MGEEDQTDSYIHQSFTNTKGLPGETVGRVREWVKKTFGGVSVVEIKDISSGLKEDREGLKKLLAKRRQIDAVVAYKDRLTRFGFEYLVELFKAYGANVVVAFQDDKDYVQELMEDFVEIVKSFAPTAKSMRRW